MEFKIDIGKMIHEQIEKEITPLDKKMRGYAFDSLIFRYKMARDAQKQAEIQKARKEGNYNAELQAESMANRDLVRFIQILDDVIGEHD